MTTNNESVFDLEPEANGARPRSKFPCRYCPEDNFSTPLVRRNHERRYHPEEFKLAEAGLADGRQEKKKSADKPDEAPTPAAPVEQPQYRATTVAGVRMDTVSEVTRKFAEALESAAPEMSPGRKRQLILSFDENSVGMQNNRGRLEHFLNRCGLLASQAEFIKLIMLGMDDGPGPGNGNLWGSPGGGPQAMTWDPQSGRMVPAPIFMMGGNNSPAASPNPFFFMPPGYGHSPGEGLTRRDLEDVVDKLAEKLKPPAATQATPAVNIRRYQRPVTGPDGQPVTDAGGHFLMAWVEEPMDPLASAIQLLSSFGVIGKQEAPVLTAEEISQAVVLGLEHLNPPSKETDPELLELKREVSESHKALQDYIHRSELKETEQKAAEDAVNRTMAAVQPMLDELKELRSKTGLTDQQYELQHQESLQKGILSTFQQALSGLRADLQPFAMQGMVAQMKTLGLEDNVIGDILQRWTPPLATAGTTSGADRRAETLQKWVND